MLKRTFVNSILIVFILLIGFSSNVWGESIDARQKIEKGNELPFIIDQENLKVSQEPYQYVLIHRGRGSKYHEVIDEKFGVEVGLVGYGVEIYSANFNTIVVVDNKTKKLLWHKDLGKSSGPRPKDFGFYIQNKSERSSEVFVQYFSHRDNTLRHFELRTGEEVSLENNG
jgi:hypothetical protein